MKRKLARRKRFRWRPRMGCKKSSPFGDIYDYIRPGGHLDPRGQPDYLASVASLLLPRGMLRKA